MRPESEMSKLGPLYVKQAEFPAFAKTPAYETTLRSGRSIRVMRLDGTCAMQVCCPQDRLPCCEDVGRLEAENLRLRTLSAELCASIDGLAMYDIEKCMPPEMVRTGTMVVKWARRVIAAAEALRAALAALEAK